MNSSPSQPPSQLTPHEVGTPQSPNLPSPSLRSLPLCGAALWLFALSSLLFAAQPPELTVLRQQYDKVVAERVTTVFDASKAALDAKFTTALDIRHRHRQGQW